MSDATPVYLEAVSILSAALRRLAEGDYNPDKPGEAVFEIAARALGDVDHVQPKPEPEQQFALVEQMGRRSTVGAVREVTFAGVPMIEVTDLRTGSAHLVSPQSVYEITWLTEDEAHARARPWTAQAITAGPDSVSIGSPEDGDYDDCEPTL